MKIVFIGLASAFTPGMSYQDNELCRQTLADGHSVTYIGNPEKFVDGVITETGPEDVILPDGLHLIRVPYCNLGPNVLTKKIRKFKGVYEILEREKPDVIFCHNTQYWSVLDAIRYKKENPKVKLYADTHVAAYNSGTNFVSLHVLHRIYYKFLMRKLIPYLEKYFYIGDGEREFAVKNYGVPESLMEFYPLGGEILSQEEYDRKRADRRAELNVADDEILLVHSGKMDASKRTADVLRAFAAASGLKAKLAIIGSIPEDMEPILKPLMAADSRVQYLGWKSGAELQEYLCACDLYCQPGGRSATMQIAVCCRCAVLSYPHEIYKKDLNYGNILWIDTEESMIEMFKRIAAGEISVAAYSERSEYCAKELLDYRTLAARLYK